MRLRARICCLIGAATLAVGVSSSLLGTTEASQGPVFHAGVDIVQLDVSVYDKDHQPVRGLTAADFTLLEDEKPRSIVAFSAVDMSDLPAASAEWMREAPIDVATNDVRDGRLFLLVLDDANLGVIYRRNDRMKVPTRRSGAEIADHVRQIAAAVVTRLGPTDLAAVVFTRDNQHAQDFTRDRALLLAAIRTYSVGIPSQAGCGTQSALTETLRTSALSLVGVPGRRKAVVVVSPGIAVDFGDMTDPKRRLPGDCSPRLGPQAVKAFTEAQRANVNFHMIDPTGISPDMFDLGTQWLQRVSDETGGEAFIGRTDFDAGVERIFQVNGSYYVLGYSSADVTQFHRVHVVIDRPGVEVKARDKYYWPEAEKAASGSAPAAATKDLSSILPKSDLPMRLTLAPFATSTKSGAVVAIAAGLHHPPADGDVVTTGEDMDLQFRGFTPEGEPRAAVARTLHIPVRPSAKGEYECDAFAALDLKPGRYEIRVAAHDATQKIDGSVYATVEIPDFAKLPVSLSGVAISVTSNRLAAPKDAFASLIPVIPTTQRDFDRGERVTAFARLYERADKPSVALPLNVRMVNDHDVTVFSTTETFTPDRFGATHSADYQLALPIATLASGPYLLTFDVARDKAAAQRDVRIQREVTSLLRSRVHVPGRDAIRDREPERA